MLPAPIPSTSGMLTSPLDARQSLLGSAITLNPGLDRGSQWPALLRATALARDADFQDAAAANRDQSVP